MLIPVHKQRHMLESYHFDMCQCKYYRHINHYFHSEEIDHYGDRHVVTLFQFYFRDWDFAYDNEIRSLAPCWRAYCTANHEKRPQMEEAEIRFIYRFFLIQERNCPFGFYVPLTPCHFPAGCFLVIPSFLQTKIQPYFQSATGTTNKENEGKNGKETFDLEKSPSKKKTKF